MKENKKYLQLFSVLALVVAVLGISVGFAAMSQTLTISGQAKVQPASWDIKFTNATFDDNSTDATATTDTTSTPQKPTLSDTTFSNYEIVLTKPGDKGTYLVTVENQGDIDATLTTANIGSTLSFTGAATDPTVKASDEAIVQANVTYTVTWDDDTAIATGSALDAGDSKVIKIEVEYDEDATELPTEPVTITGRDVTLIYTQAD